MIYSDDFVSVFANSTVLSFGALCTFKDIQEEGYPKSGTPIIYASPNEYISTGIFLEKSIGDNEQEHLLEIIVPDAADCLPEYDKVVIDRDGSVTINDEEDWPCWIEAPKTIEEVMNILEQCWKTYRKNEDPHCDFEEFSQELHSLKIDSFFKVFSCDEGTEEDFLEAFPELKPFCKIKKEESKNKEDIWKYNNTLIGKDRK